MLLGHFGAALAAKAIEPSLPLPALMLGTQLIDVVWAGLLLTGVEKVRMQPKYTATTDFELTYYPYSHSLPGAVAISAIGAAGAAVLYPQLSGAALVILFAVVLSHWFLDLLVHVPDLPLLGDRYKVGFGLWNNRPLAMALEFGIFFAGAAMYLISLTPAQTDAATIPLAVVLGGLTLLQFQAFYGPPMKTVQQLALTALLIYALATAGGYWLDASVAGV